MVAVDQLYTGLARVVQGDLHLVQGNYMRDNAVYWQAVCLEQTS
jgi:hypothetical protein